MIKAKITSTRVTATKVPRIRKKTTKHQRRQPLFSSSIESVIEDVDVDEPAIKYDRRTKRANRDMDEWHARMQKGFVPHINSKFYPEYGVMFNDRGYILPGLKKTYLFTTIEIPRSEELLNLMEWLPDCEDWAIANLRGWQSTAIHPERERELIHKIICTDINAAFQKNYESLMAEWDYVSAIASSKIPKFLPNKIVQTMHGPAVQLPSGEYMYSRYKPKRQKRIAITAALGLAFSGINAIGGLAIKGMDTWNNYKRNKAMSKAMDVLIENDKRFHNRMVKMEEDMGLITHTIATGFEQVNEGFSKLNRDVTRVTYRVESMMNQTERYFIETHEQLNNHHLALYYLGKSISLLAPVLSKVRHKLLNFKFMLKGFMDGLDELSTGRLSYEVLDPLTLAKSLRHIALDLDRSDSQYILAFDHTYQYYAEPMVSFTNGPDDVLIQIPIFLRYKFQLPMSLFSTQVLPVPYDAETYLGLRLQFTEAQIAQGYFAVTPSQYTKVSAKQLDLCWKLRNIYYCEQAYLLVSKEVHSCEAAIYYEMSAEVKTATCDFQFTQNKKYPPRIVDTGNQFVLSMLPEPWILMCDGSQRPFTIPYSTYRIINHTELCDCSLSAGFDYQINKAQITCPEDYEADEEFKTYFAYNQAVADVLNSTFDLDISQELAEFTKLSEDIPTYNLPTLNWFPIDQNEFENVYDTGTPVVEVSLINMLKDVSEDIEERIYRNTEEWLIAQRDFYTYMKEAEWWQMMQIICAVLGALCWIAAIAILCCYKRMIIATILGSKQLDEYEMVKSIPQGANAAPTLPPHVQPILTLFPPDEDDNLDEPTHPKSLMSIMFLVIIIILSVLAAFICMWKRFRWGSSLMRSWFPLFSRSGYHRGTCRAEIFVEVTETSSHKSIWAMFKKVSVHPTALRYGGTLSSRDITIIKNCGCRTMRINWENVEIQGTNRIPLNMPTTGAVSIWTSSDLNHIDKHQQYTVTIMGRVLDMIYKIPLDPTIHPRNLGRGAAVSSIEDPTETGEGAMAMASDKTPPQYTLY